MGDDFGTLPGLPDPRQAGRIHDLVPDVGTGSEERGEARTVADHAGEDPPPSSQSWRRLAHLLPLGQGNSYRAVSRDPESLVPRGDVDNRRWLVLAATIVAVMVAATLVVHVVTRGSSVVRVPRRPEQQDSVHFANRVAGSWGTAMAALPLPPDAAVQLKPGSFVEAHFHRNGIANGVRSTYADQGVVVATGREVAVEFDHAGTQVIPLDWIVAVLPGVSSTPKAATFPRAPALPAPGQASGTPEDVVERLAAVAAARTTTSTWTWTTTRRTSPVPTTTTTIRTTRPTTPAPVVPRATEPPVPKAKGPIQLFCFAVMMSEGAELSLVRTQLAQGAGIFGCDSWIVFSDQQTWLTPGPPVRIDTVLVPTNLTAKWDGVSTHFRNTGQFVQAWQKIREDGRYRIADWVVKADPDAVFFPNRLRWRVQDIDAHSGNGVYLLNCNGFGSKWMFGALEVLSRAAVDAYFASNDRCLKQLDWTSLGEDTFLAKCLDLLGTGRVEAFDTVLDEYCNKPPAPCTSRAAVAFHPFKTPEGYFQCWAAATRMDSIDVDESGVPGGPELFQ